MVTTGYGVRGTAYQGSRFLVQLNRLQGSCFVVTGYRVRGTGFVVTGYRVRGTWLQEYGVTVFRGNGVTG